MREASVEASQTFLGFGLVWVRRSAGRPGTSGFRIDRSARQFDAFEPEENKKMFIYFQNLRKMNDVSYFLKII